LNEKTRHTCVYYPYNMEIEKQTIVVRVEISTLLGQNGKVSRRKMDRLAMVITNLHNSGMHVLVVSSGAIILGSEKLKLQQLPDTQLDMQATAAVGQAELMRWYQRSFDEYGQIVAQVLLTSDIIAYPQRVENTRNTFNTLLEMSIIPIINENDPVSTSDIEFDDNYPLALIVAQIARADFIVIKMEMNGKYLIVPGNNLAAMVVDGETELQEKLESCCHVMMNGKVADELNFPASIGEIVF
jgi:glutamate 5-kinase